MKTEAEIITPSEEITYVIPEDLPISVLKLPLSYLNKTQIQLTPHQQFNAVQRFLRYKNTALRYAQVLFLYRVVALFHHQLRIENNFLSHIDNPHQLTSLGGKHLQIADLNPQECIETMLAYKLLCTAILFIRSKTTMGSDLGSLLDEALGLDKKNVVTPAARAHLIVLTKLFFVNNPLSTLMPKLGVLEPKDYLYFEQFYAFVEQQHAALGAYTYNADFIIDVLARTVAEPCRIVGYSVGFLAGEVFSNTTVMMPIQRYLTSLLGFFLLCINPSASMAVFLLTPAVANKILTTILGFSLATLLGTVMENVGKSLVYGTGFSLKTACSMLKNIYGYAYYYLKDPALSPINGFLLSGHVVKHGKILSNDKKTTTTIEEIDDDNDNNDAHHAVITYSSSKMRLY